MKAISFDTAYDGAVYSALKDDADLSKLEKDAVVRWEFESKDEDTLSLIQTGDGVIDFNLRRDANGQVNDASYEVAYIVSYSRTHLLRYSRGGTWIEKPSPDQVLALPFPVLKAYFLKTRIGLDWSKVAKKEVPDNPGK